jgi:hypothetical protein
LSCSSKKLSLQAMAGRSLKLCVQYGATNSPCRARSELPWNPCTAYRRPTLGHSRFTLIVCAPCLPPQVCPRGLCASDRLSASIWPRIHLDSADTSDQRGHTHAQGPKHAPAHHLHLPDARITASRGRGRRLRRRAARRTIRSSLVLVTVAVAVIVLGRGRVGEEVLAGGQELRGDARAVGAAGWAGGGG